MFVLDSSIKKTEIYLAYIKAFYVGMTVKMVTPGGNISSTLKLPLDFIKSNSIKLREHYGEV